MPNFGPVVLRSQGLAGHSEAYADGFHWKVMKRNPVTGVINVKCCGLANAACLATGKFDRGWNFEYVSGVHNHPPDETAQLVYTCWLRLSNAMSTSNRDIQEVYDEVMASFESVRGIIIFEEFSPRFQRWQDQAVFDTSVTFHEFVRLIQSERYCAMLRHNGGMMSVSIVTAQNGQSALVVGDTGFSRELPDGWKLHVTTIPQIKPVIDNTQHVITITAEVQNRSLVFGWVLVNVISEDLLKSIMGYIRRDYLLNASPQQIYTNLDWRFVIAAAETWPESTIKVSFHQYSLTVLHKCHNTEGIDLPNADHKVIVTKLMALALLPPENIGETLQILFESMDASSVEIFSSIVTWYYDAIISVITPNSLSYFRDEAAFYILEMNLATRLLQKLKTPEPSIWPFYKKCTKVVEESRQDLQTLKHGTPEQIRNISMTPKLSSTILLAHVRLLWRGLTDESIVPTTFLSQMVYQLQAYCNFMFHNHNYESGPFEMLPGEPARNERHQVVQGRVQRNPEELVRVISWQEFLQLRRRRRVAIADNVANIVGQRAGEPGAANEEIAPYNWRCSQCQQRPVELICMPCRCISLCRQCDYTLQGEGVFICPECNNHVINLERVFIDSNKNRDLNGDVYYDWTCVVCLQGLISMMAQICHHVFCCVDCGGTLTALALAGHTDVLCPICRRVGPLIEVHIRRN